MSGTMKRFFGFTAAAILGAALTLVAYETLIGPQDTVRVIERESPPVQYANFPVGPDGKALDFTQAAERTVNAVVHIQTQTVHPQSMNPWFELFGQGAPQTLQSSGSGVIISPDGYVVTNNHVVEGASRIQLTLNDNRTLAAEVIGADPAFDLALLKVDEEDLPSVSFGDSDDVRIGEWVLAVGNPFNLTSTVTAGIVSAKARNINILQYDPNRQIFPVESFIQTDAAVNPGNSGGALVNTRGELIGINTAIASRTGSYSGYSFAVPSSIVQKVAHDLLEYGDVKRAYIGVSISDLNQETADRLGIVDVTGVYVRGLTPGGAAAEVGIEVGDIIKEVSGHPVDNVPELQERISTYRPGDEVEIIVKRGNKLLAYDVVVRDRDGNASIIPSTKVENHMAMGGLFERPSTGDLSRLGITSGAKLKEDRQGRFRRAGIKEGFIITRIDKKSVTGPEDVTALLDSKEGGVLIEGIYPNGTVAYYGFGM
ncbi:MAG: PDZ domain-containing protein [Flavobacteriales bacterium]|nr:PDZ domain-containing protein [Flavobacteriales bacterium]